MSSDGHHMTTTAKLHFTVPPSGDVDRRLNIVKPDGTYEWDYGTEYKEVSVENLRTREPENSATLDVEGFQLFSNCPTTFEAFNDPEEIVRAYYPESVDLVKKITGASQIIVWEHFIRRRRVADTPFSLGQPSSNVHVDFSPSQSLSLLHKSFPESEVPALPERRFQILSFWRPLYHAAYDSPLILGDYRTLNMKEDLVPTTRVRPDGTFEVLGVKYSENHKWGYYYGMTPDEVVLIKAYDSSKDGSVAFCTPHSSFEDPYTPKGSPPRESIEVRMIVMYE